MSDGSTPAGGYTKKGKKRREKQMKEAGTWAKKKDPYGKPPSGKRGI